MKLVFTICSNNYLSQAICLGDSLLEHNPYDNFVIVLVDRIEGIKSLRNRIKYELIEVEQIVGSRINELSKVYNIIELNTAVKPSVFKFFFQNEDVKSIIYLDPDILVYNSFQELYTKQKSFNFIMTPHITTPSDGSVAPSDIVFISGGVFNLGFISISRTEESLKILDWWENKLLNKGAKVNLFADLFYDQLWMNLIVSFSGSVFVERNLGYNMAPWNIHERKLSFCQGQYSVNDKYPLIFYHFSGFKYNREAFISVHTQNKISEREDIIKIYKDYRQKLTSAKYLEFSKVKCYYKTKKINKDNMIRSFLRRIVLKVLYRI
jgi:hypothetical protein